MKELQYIPDIIDLIQEELSGGHFANPPFGGSYMKVWQFFYPFSISYATKGLTNHFLSKAGYTDTYTPLKEFMSKAGFNAIPKEELSDDYNDVFLMISFYHYPAISNKLKKLYANEKLLFFVIPYGESEEDYKILLKSEPNENIFLDMKESRILDPNSEDKEDQIYLNTLSKAIKFICKRLGIVVNDELLNLTTDEALSEFMNLCEVKDKEEFKSCFYKVLLEPEICSAELAEQGYADPDETLSEKELFYSFLLAPMLEAYEDDWKFDTKDLSAYIFKFTGKRLRLSEDMELFDVADRLEKRSEFSLIEIDTQMDSICVFVCKKDHKEKIVDLGRMLGFDIKGF
ncbi:hypothetical protein [Campylobacter sp. RM16188]|uniref:DUF6630 family protein n=1 Tax=Campylobacter sp. RM16188 TaxID=1705725 RepID=UPI001557F653|nr:hypothetical protein [Campylobacter sp. RM16188]